MKCIYHPEREAAGKCSDCGKDICSLCLTTTAFNINAAHLAIPLADKRYCPTCIDKLIHENLERSPNLSKKPVTANDVSSKQDLVIETSSQETATVAPIKVQDAPKANQVSAPKKAGISETNSFVMGHIKRSDRNKLIKYVIICIILISITIAVYLRSSLVEFYGCLSVTLVITAVCISKYKRRVSNLERRPSFKILTRFGDFDSVRAQIDAEAVSSTSVIFNKVKMQIKDRKAVRTSINSSKLYFTQNWVLCPHFGGLYVIHRPTLVWAYSQHLATHNSINFIPVGTTHTHSVLMHYTGPAKRQGFVNVCVLEIETKNEAASNDLLGCILRYAPWIVAGYTPEIAESWKKNTSEMLAFAANRYDNFILGAAKQ